MKIDKRELDKQQNKHLEFHPIQAYDQSGYDQSDEQWHEGDDVEGIRHSTNFATFGSKTWSECGSSCLSRAKTLSELSNDVEGHCTCRQIRLRAMLRNI